MTMATNEKVDAYKTHQRTNETDREIEARALLTCANQMVAARDGGKITEFYTSTLTLNQRLWTIFQVALCDPANPLPAELKNTLLNLSCYVDKVCFRALAEFQGPLLTELIDINRSIATGLSVKNQAAAPPPAPMTQPVGPLNTSA